MRRPDRPWKTFTLDLTQPIVDNLLFGNSEDYMILRNRENARQSDDDSDVGQYNNYVDDQFSEGLPNNNVKQIIAKDLDADQNKRISTREDFDLNVNDED